jgi:hypothetical protein
VNLSHAEEIQLTYPEEPDWSKVPDSTLIELVQTYCQEPSCAAIAIGMHRRRGREEARILAQWILQEEHADQWLKAAATDMLETFTKEQPN